MEGANSAGAGGLGKGAWQERSEGPLGVSRAAREASRTEGTGKRGCERGGIEQRAGKAQKLRRDR